MAPQTRSATRHTTRSSTKVKASSPKAGTSKTNRPRKAISTSKQKPEPKPTRKRARRASIESKAVLPITAPKRAKPSAKLEIFMNMPVEVFIEIAKYLRPFDLVLLSRVNKFFRELFMSRRASPIWREAQLSVEGLPPCPKSISEPQYAAMLFTKMCSTCGKWAPRNMDPILLVRLCTKCREKQAVDTSVVTDWTLVFASSDLIPGKNRDVSWCLYSDARAVKSKLNELDAAGDEEAKELWVQERRKEVEQRFKHAQPLRQWLKDRDQTRETELDDIKSARQSEIESRLIKLGWEKGDFNPSDYWRRKHWRSLVYNVKPLNDRAWTELLPQLLDQLKINREERFEKEKIDRRNERGYKLRDWFHTIVIEAGPLGRATSTDESTALTSTEAQFESYRMLFLLRRAFPCLSRVCAWPEFQTLRETDIPTEDFTAKLNKQHHMLEDLIVKWRNTLEARLINQLPKDIQAPKFDNAPGFTLTIAKLPVRLRKLLRADAAFREGSQLYFYPDDFANATTDTDKLVYHEKAAKVAKALLQALNRPNASYLELKALGRVFHCGRCNKPPQYLPWSYLVSHYLSEADEWLRHSESSHVQSAKNFTYLFTHDVDVVNPNKPLVRIVHRKDQTPNQTQVSRACKLCRDVNIGSWHYDDHIFDHLRDVHLIEEPEPGKHY